MKFLITQYSPASCHFIPLTYKYSPQHPALKQRESVFFPLNEGLKFYLYKTTGELTGFYIIICCLHYLRFVILVKD